jgi:hypothetical protein
LAVLAHRTSLITPSLSLIRRSRRSDRNAVKKFQMLIFIHVMPDGLDGEFEFITARSQPAPISRHLVRCQDISIRHEVVEAG